MPTKSENPYLSDLKIQIDRITVSNEFMKDVLQMTVEESLHLPAMFTLVIQNRYSPTSDKPESQPWRYDKLLQIGKKVNLGFGMSTTLDPNFKEQIQKLLIEGEITGMEVHFNEKSEADIIVRGYDISHRLHRGRYNRTFTKQRDSQIVRTIAEEVGIKIGNIETTTTIHEHVFQENQTNMEFLRERAARIGFELFVADGEINFCQPTSEGNLSLKWRVDINRFSVRVTSAEQVNSVQVRAWDYENKKVIIGKATTEEQLTETGNNLGSTTSTVFPNLKPYEMTVVDKPVTDQAKADIMAKALCDELGGEFVYADASAEGTPDIRPRRVISLEGVGDRYSGDYYVTETRHFYTNRVYYTDFSVRGQRSGDLFTTISTQKRLQPSETLLVGIVTDNKDPQSLGRVKVKFPTLTELHTTDWARIVALGAGTNRGFDCLPEVDDEVLVGFEHGDIHRPYIIGGVWNGIDTPPEETANSVTAKGLVRLRTFKTREGHTLQFIEEDASNSKTGIRLQTKYGHEIYLNDSEKCIVIQTPSGHIIKMDDTAPIPSVSVESKGNLSLDALGNIDITAGGEITVKGAMIHLN
ncbi:VgrG-related protein [Nostoc sp. NMS4]|uniref:VgrG-related protein n=1 Tax=Nostoc sp. NMS4 TaxID=2815390 RepID=UPI0025E97E7E|nr:VgrG-related protein [Nostoc sp. NMS4]MBN3924791.1 VgrG-related protein [Nostoc sp. NMS4]